MTLLLLALAPRSKLGILTYKDEDSDGSKEECVEDVRSKKNEHEAETEKEQERDIKNNE